MGKSDDMTWRPIRRRNHSDARKKYPKGYASAPASYHDAAHDVNEDDRTSRYAATRAPRTGIFREEGGRPTMRLRHEEPIRTSSADRPHDSGDAADLSIMGHSNYAIPAPDERNRDG